jgi:hypothetical protein
MKHESPPSDLELVLGTLWPHLPKKTLRQDKWAPAPCIKIIDKTGKITLARLYLDDTVLTICTDIAIVMTDVRIMENIGAWNIADPNSTMQIVNKIKELRNDSVRLNKNVAC